MGFKRESQTSNMKLRSLIIQLFSVLSAEKLHDIDTLEKPLLDLFQVGINKLAEVLERDATPITTSVSLETINPNRNTESLGAGPRGDPIPYQDSNTIKHYKFTNCGTTGYRGPSHEKCVNFY